MNGNKFPLKCLEWNFLLLYMHKFMHKLHVYLSRLWKVIHGHINMSHAILVSHIKYLLIQQCPLQSICTYLHIISLIFSPLLHCQWTKKQLSTLWLMQFANVVVQCEEKQKHKAYTALTAEQRTTCIIGKYISEHSNSASMKKFKANESVRWKHKAI